LEKIKLYIVDDHQIMIDGIKALLIHHPQFEIIGEQTNPVLAVEAIQANTPDVIITDINMKELSGIELTRQVKSLNPTIKILALSMHGDRETISEMLEAGINGYVLKNTGTEELVAALTKLSLDQPFFSDDVTTEMMRTISNAKTPQKEFVHLTQREIEIVKLISEEYNNAKIGETLFISERTVETHRKNIFRKTNTKTVVGLMKFAVEQKII
jgi:two-component system, NarL family, nitrate/nitrite response regulator NarL